MIRSPSRGRSSTRAPTRLAKAGRDGEEHVHVDNLISGAEFANRPGFLRLMNVLNRGRRSRR